MNKIYGKIHYYECSHCKKGYILNKNEIPEFCLCENPEFHDIYLRETAKHLIKYVMSVLVFVIIPVLILVLMDEYNVDGAAITVVSWIFAFGSFVCGAVAAGYLVVNFRQMSHFILMRDEKLRNKISSAYIENVTDIENAVNSILSQEIEDSEKNSKLGDLYEYAYKLSFIYDCPRLAMARFRCMSRFPVFENTAVISEIERISAQLCVFSQTDEDENLKKYIEDIAQRDRSQIGYNSIRLYERLFYRGDFYSRIKEENMTEKYSLLIKGRNPILYNEGIRAANVFAAALVNIKSVVMFHGEIIMLKPFMRPSDLALLDEIIQKEESDE